MHQHENNLQQLVFLYYTFNALLCIPYPFELSGFAIKLIVTLLQVLKLHALVSV